MTLLQQDCRTEFLRWQWRLQVATTATEESGILSPVVSARSVADEWYLRLATALETWSGLVRVGDEPRAPEPISQIGSALPREGEASR